MSLNVPTVIDSILFYHSEEEEEQVPVEVKTSERPEIEIMILSGFGCCVIFIWRNS